MTVDLSTANIFRDRAIQDDPYPYFDALRDRSPVCQEQNYGIFMVTGYEEARLIYTRTAEFSSCNVVSGPFVRFPEPLEGDDVTDIIERHRDMLPFSDQLPSFDPPRHTEHRALMMRFLTPGQLRSNEEFMTRLADRLVDEIVEQGACEFITSYAAPYTLQVIADLEGVPESDHGLFAKRLAKTPETMEHKPLEFLYGQFAKYIEERRREPRDDIMTSMANATFSDGTTPEVNDVALLAANLFSGGQETTVRLLSFLLKFLGERPDIQERLRDDRELIPNFIEETLRFESPLRAQFRMAKVTTSIGGVTIPAGSTVLLLPGAANRDPRMFERPAEFDIDRANVRQHITFGHGAHHCAGAYLARAEGRVTVHQLLDRTSNITIAEPRSYEYLPTYFLRGLDRLDVVLEPSGA